MFAADNRERWYAIHTHPKQEGRAESNLRAWNVETFCPKLEEHRRHPYTNAPVSIIKHLFPRYIFARFNADKLLHKVSLTRGVSSVVRLGNSPAPVSDEIIELIRSRIMDDGLIRLGERVKLGDKIEIEGGPLSSFVGFFERELNDSDRVVILLAAVSYQCRVVVEREQIRRVG